MKKIILLSITMSVLGLSSCDSEDSKKENKTVVNNSISLCDCIEGRNALMKRIEEADGDEEKMKEIEAESEDLKLACEKMGKEKAKEIEGLDDKEREEKMKEWSEEAEECGL